MIPNITGGSSFAGALRYDMDKEKGYLLGTNCASTEANEIAIEMDVIAASSRTKKPVHHVSLRLPPGEKLTDDKWKQVCDKYLQKMGYITNQFAATRHMDKIEGDHIHLVINRVGIDGKLTNDFQEKRRSQQACREIEKELNLVRLEDHQNLDKGRMIDVKTSLFDSITESKGKSVKELESTLRQRGYDLILHIQSTGRIQGASIKSLDDGKTWKLSQLIKGGFKTVQNLISEKQIGIKNANYNAPTSMELVPQASQNINVKININGKISDGMIAGADRDTAEYLIYLKKQQESKINFER